MRILAKKDYSTPDEGRVKFRVIEFEVEGSNATLTEGIRNLAMAITRGNGANGRAAHQQPKVIAGELSSSVPDDLTEEAENEEPPISTSSSSTPRARRPRTINSPEILDLDLASGDVPLKKFIEEKNPDGDTKRYLAIAFWFKHHGNIADVTVNHIHTAYRHLQLKTPKDAAQPLRDLKSKNQWLSKAEGKGAYTINHIGENIVNGMP